MSYYVYVVLNPDGKTYVGQTADLERRVAQHNHPEFRGTLHTKRYPGPWRLVHSEPYPTRSAATRKERELKTGKGRQWLRQNVLGGCQFAKANSRSQVRLRRIPVLAAEPQRC